MAAQARGQQTRVRILSAALAEFSRQGYDATGVADICSAAGVTKGAFYYHFATKQAVFLELLDSWLRQIEGRVRQTMVTEELAPTRLLGMAHMARQVLRDAHGQLPMFLAFWAQAARDPVAWKTIIEPYRQYRDLFAGMVENGIDEGSLRRVDSEAAAQTILALAVGMMLQGLLDPDGADWGRAAENGVALILDGLRRRS
jgi:AcrR family transcriptional regulator